MHQKKIETGYSRIIMKKLDKKKNLECKDVVNAKTIHAIVFPVIMHGVKAGRLIHLKRSEEGEVNGFWG